MASHLAGLDLRDKSRDEIKAIADAKTAAVQDWAANYIAGLQKPREIQSSRRYERIAMAMVIHEERDLWVKVSVDGDPANARGIPRTELTINKETEDFALVVMQGRVAIKWKLAQGTVPTLTDKREWSAEQREAWKRLRKTLVASRERLKPDNTRRKFGRRIKVYDTNLPSYRVGE